ncbi:MAG: hypothetical protein H0T63_03365 [Pyrinomonadaceae bacterium]|nr:hypothetical protein [Pyrinomonadaceae bacterium]
MSSSFSSVCRLGFLVSIFTFTLSLLCLPAQAQRRGVSPGRERAVVVDERLAALRDEPRLTAALVRRLGRGRQVSLIGPMRQSDGVNFYRVAVTRRTRGWLPAESLAMPSRAGDDERLLRLLRASEDFDRIARARLFLDIFSRSPLRPAVLSALGAAAEAAAVKLTRDAARRLDEAEMKSSGAPVQAFYLNFNGLDRYHKQGVIFTFDRMTKQFHYDGAAWREIVRRYPRSSEAAVARKRLEVLAATTTR